MYKSKEDLRSLLYQKDGEWHTKCTEVLEDNDEVSAYFEVVAEMLEDKQIMFVFDDGSTDEACFFIHYKDGNHFLSQYVLPQDGQYVLNTANLLWQTDYHRLLNGSEVYDFITALKDYLEKTGFNLFINMTKQQQRFMIYPTVTEDLPERKQEKIKMMATFSRTILLLILLVPAVVVAIIFSNNGKETLYPTLMAVGIGIACYGLYFIIGALLKFKHVYCALQAQNRMPMTPCEVNWKHLTNLEKFLKPVMYIVLGIFLFLMALFA